MSYPMFRRTVCFGLAGLWLCAIAVAEVSDASLAEQYAPTPPQVGEVAIAAASRLLAKAQLAGSLPLDGPKSKTAKFLNALAHAHCRSEQPHTGRGDINELFDRCATACGGYSYVLKGLLAVYGISSRYINFYNMPNQGNHTAIEALIDGRWVFLDPTFGLYFTLEKSAFGAIATLQDVRFRLAGSALADHVSIVTHRDAERVLRQPVLAVRTGEIDNPYMSLENYHRAKRVTPEGLTSLLPLSLSLDLANGRSSFGAQHDEWQTPADAEAKFLAATNATLLDVDDANDVSFHYSYLGTNKQFYESLTMLGVANLQAQQSYEIELSGYNETSGAILQASEVGGSVFYATSPVWSLPKGKWRISMRVFAKSDQAMFAFSRRDRSPGFARLFGVSVTKVRQLRSPSSQ